MSKSTMATILGTVALGLIKKHSGSFNREYSPRTLKWLLKTSKKKALEVTSLHASGLMFTSDNNHNNIKPFPEWVIKNGKGLNIKKTFSESIQTLLKGFSLKEMSISIEIAKPFPVFLKSL